MDRKDIYDLIDKERDYQDSLPQHNKALDASHGTSAWIIFMEDRLNRAKKAVYNLDQTKATQEIIKVMALGVACLENKM